MTRFSTASLDMPGASTWTSTSGGANSGKTSSGLRMASANAGDEDHGGGDDDDPAKAQGGMNQLTQHRRFLPFSPRFVEPGAGIALQKHDANARRPDRPGSANRG